MEKEYAILVETTLNTLSQEYMQNVMAVVSKNEYITKYIKENGIRKVFEQNPEITVPFRITINYLKPEYKSFELFFKNEPDENFINEFKNYLNTNVGKFNYKLVTITKRTKIEIESI